MPNKKKSTSNPTTTNSSAQPPAQPSVFRNKIASAFKPLPDGTYQEFILVENSSGNLEFYWIEGRTPADYKFLTVKAVNPAADPILCLDRLIFRNLPPVNINDFKLLRIDNLRLCEANTLGITQFTLYAKNNEPLFVVDVVAAESVIEWKPKGVNNSSDFSIKGRVRNFFKSDSDKDLVTLEIKIKKKGNEEIKYDEIKLNGQPFPNMPKDFKWGDLKEKIIAHELAPFTTILQGEKNEFSDLFPRALDLDLIDIKESRPVHVTFGYPVQTEAGSTLYSLKFTSNIKTATDPNKTGGWKIFNKEKFSVGRPHLVDADLKFVQYPARSLKAFSLWTPPSTNVRAKWIVQVQMPADVFYRAWNEHISGEYYKSLKLIKSGHKLSFLPRFELGQPDAGRWTIAYRLTDSIIYPLRFDISKGTYHFDGGYEPPKFAFSGPGRNEIWVEGLTLQPNSVRKATAVFEHLQTHEREPLKSAFTLDVTLIDDKIKDDDQKNETPALYKRFEADDSRFNEKIVVPVKQDVFSFGKSQIRMGALDIGFACPPDNNNTTQTNSNADQKKEFTGIIIDPYEKDLFNVSIQQIYLAVSRINAGGQDDLPLEEFVPLNSVTSNLKREKFLGNDQEILKAVENCGSLPADEDVDDLEAAIEARFRRARPLVINPQKNEGATIDCQMRYALRVDEKTQEQGSQTIRLSLQQKSDPDPRELHQAIVLDNEPFLVAQVKFHPFSFFEGNSDKEVATWTNAALEGAGWQLASYSRPITLVLPPQGVGEAMEKAKNIDESKSVDFRLSPPAVIKLDPSKAPKIFFDKDDVGKPRQKFNEPPWNLRRILGFPGQTSPGLEIKHLQFELLYGLSCDSEFPLLRLAEITSLLGAIPGRLRRVDKAKSKCAYLQARVEWAHLYNRYSSRIAIFEPWTEQQVGKLLLNKSTVCRIRNRADEQNILQRPLEPLERPAELFNPVESPDNQTPTDLKGGVTWGFESKNVYNAVMRPGKSRNPESDEQTTTISDLRFSSFGGWGNIKAPFDERRSTIYGDVSMGRTYTYKLERIGRIGCWWNIAQHVIVYERTVMPSSQMSEMQNGLEGLPVLRKVREYVKILQARREYPDGEASGTPELAKQRGCVKACLFKEGAEFNVLSSWGADIGEVGWKVPLWNPNAPLRDYPKPEVQLELLSNVNGVSTPDPCTIDNPQNLYFYTDTQAGTGADPDKWLPVKDVDFVDLPAPKPSTDFTSGVNVQTTPDDPVVHPGTGICTFLLKPNSVPADLVAGRVGKPLAAILESVTMMRANFKDLGQNFSNLAEIERESAHHKLINLREKAAQAHQAILVKIEQGVNRESLPIASEINKVVKELESVKSGFNDLKKKLEDKITAYESNAFRRLHDKYEEFLTKAEIVKTYDDLLKEIDTLPVEEIRRRGLQVFRALQEGQMLLNGSPGAMQRALNQYAPTFSKWFAAYTEWIDTVKRRADEVNVFIANLPNDITGNQLAEVENRLRRLVEESDKLQARLNSGDLRRVVEWLPGPVAVFNSNYADEILKGFLEKYAQAGKNIDELLNRITAEKAKVQGAVEKAKVQEVANFYRNEFEAFRAKLVSAQDKLTNDLKEFTAIESKLEGLKSKLNDEIAKKFNEVTKPELQKEALKQAVEKVKAKAESFKTELDNFEKEVNANVKSVFEKWKFDNTDYAINKLKNELERIKNIPLNSADLSAEISRQRDRFLKEAENFVEANVRALMPDKDVYAVADKIPKLIRAFGKPPEVPNLTFDRPQLAYFYEKLSDRVDITPVLSRVAQANQAVETLKPLGIALPTEALRDKLLPPDLKNFKLSDILPKFAGLDLTDLFSGIKMPDMSNDNLRISHGLDPQARRAWVEADVKVQFTEEATVFSIGPVILRLKAALFDAKVIFETTIGQPPKKTVYGRIKGDWELIVANIPVVIFKETELRFDESGKFRFNLSPANVELPEIMSFVSEFLKSFSDPDSGFSIGLTKMGIRAILSLPIPDVQGATSGFSNLILGMSFGLDFSDGFKISIGFSLGRKETPFAVTVFILGGGGYMEVTAFYTPSTRVIDCEVEIGIVVSASVAIALGPIKGGVYVYFGITARYVLRPGNNQDSGLTVGVLYLIRGQVSILGIVSASVSLMLEATYRNKKLTGRGRFSIKIKICWCFTLEVNEEVEYTLGGGGGSNSRNLDNRRDERAALNPPASTPIPASTWKTPQVNRDELIYQKVGSRAENSFVNPRNEKLKTLDGGDAIKTRGKRAEAAATANRFVSAQPLLRPEEYKDKASIYIEMLSED